ncbi:unnamed protein product, partial [Urochloa humidicola]
GESATPSFGEAPWRIKEVLGGSGVLHLAGFFLWVSLCAGGVAKVGDDGNGVNSFFSAETWSVFCRRFGDDSVLFGFSLLRRWSNAP